MPIAEIGAYPPRFDVDSFDFSVVKVQIWIKRIPSVPGTGAWTNDMRDDRGAFEWPVERADTGTYERRPFFPTTDTVMTGMDKNSPATNAFL